MTKEAILGLITKLKDWLQNGLQILSEFEELVKQTPEEIMKNAKSDFLSKDSQIYARVLSQEHKIFIFPIESFQVKVNDPAIIWLKSHVYTKASRKHNFNFEFVEKDGLLKEICVLGQLNEKEKEKLLNATRWALEKAISR